MIRKITVFFLAMMLLLPLNGLAAVNSNISIDYNYLVISPADDGSTNVTVMDNYTNTSTDVYQGDGNGEGVLKISLPQGATNLNLMNNQIASKQVDSGFITMDPIQANQSVALQYSYKIPKGQEINFSFNYPVKAMQILVPEGMGSVELKGVQATNLGLFDFDSKKYWEYSVEQIEATKPFTMIYNKDKQPPADAANNSTATSTDSKTNVTKSSPAFHNPGHIRLWEQSPLHSFNPHIFLIVLLAMIIAGLTYYAYYRRKAKLEEVRLGADKEEKAFKLLMAKQKAIMDKIIELEETFGDGKLSEDDFHKKLEAYKQHLVQVKLNLREFVE